MAFPIQRPRRLRRTESLRRLVRETHLVPEQLILPLFVRAGTGVRRTIDAMPGVAQTSVDELLRDAERAAKAGVGGVLLFGIPEHKMRRAPSPGPTTGPCNAPCARSNASCLTWS